MDTELLTGVFMPDLFKRGDNLDIFIKECLQYFEVGKIPKFIREILPTVCLVMDNQKKNKAEK